MSISIPASWIPGLQAILILASAIGFLLDIPLILLLPLALASVLMVQDAPTAKEYKPVTILLVLSGLGFLFTLNTLGWIFALAAIALSVSVLLGLRPYQKMQAEKEHWQHKVLKR